ncbi:MerR family transcriptional regulator [Clostridium botulinum]|uniref:MerR family transcriptional regulator n=3 Tax=Clostridium botulinum TaxID=1491 RepID=A0ABD7CK67_CLOBO|nr:MerR family transcriptional regulator [Clostridium botulinum]QRI53346.1 MerR family transcriptional regulator [Clostridium botulinum]
MVIVNHHLDLGHIKAIENAKDILNKGCSLKVLEVASSIIYSQSEKENAKIVNSDLGMEREIHANVRETSFMLFKHPELVKDCYELYDFEVNKYMYTIGQLALILKVSTRTLRHYDDIGLLKPYCINEENGYRYYEQEQISLAKNIMKLKGYGLILEEIKEIIANSNINM